MPDGAAVSTGTTKGVAARLKQLNPRLINFHCVCHRLALACTDSLENVSYIKVFWHGWLSYGECFKIHQRRWLSTSKPRLKWNCWHCQAMRPVNVPLDIWKRHVLLDGFLSMHPLTKTVDAEYPASLHTLNTLKNTDVTTLGLFSKVKDVFKSSLGLCTFLLNCYLTAQTWVGRGQWIFQELLQL